MLFRIEPTPFHRGPKPLPAFKWIEAIAVLPLAVNPDGAIRNTFLCRTDAGLQRIEEAEIGDALKVGQYRESRRSRRASFTSPRSS